MRWARPGLVLCALGAGLAGLWQIDLVRQNAEIAWLNITGRVWVLRGAMRAQRVWSAALGEARQVAVYTPPGYDDPKNAGRRYPVLYLLHGAPDSGAGWIRYGRAPQVIDRLIVHREIPPMIVVCPDGRGDGAFGDSEYLDAPAPRPGGRPGRRVATFITQDLPAAIDARYRTVASSRGRLLGGVSTGGYAAVNLGLRRPDVWGTLLAFSGYYAADPSGYARPVWGYHPDPALLRAQSPRRYVDRYEARWARTFIYLGNGGSERLHYRREADAFARRLQGAKIPFVQRCLPGKHSWDLWRDMLADALHVVRDRLAVQ